MTTRKKHKRATKKLAGNDSCRPDYGSIAEKLCEMGATRIDLASAFNVTSATIDRWLAENPEFTDSCALGNERANDRVTRSLYERAVGYAYDAEKLFNSKGTLIRATYRVHIPPDPRAAMFWLKHRAWQKWPDDPDKKGDDPFTQYLRSISEKILCPRELPPDEPEEIQDIKKRGEQDEP